MPVNGTMNTVISDLVGKKASQSTIIKAMANGAQEAKKSDPKKKK